MIVDLRDYTVQPEALDKLIARFEALFMDEQERLGARMLGAFRDLDRPDRFVWVRACEDMPSRQRILSEFYERGAMWQQYKAETNTWMTDSDNVLLVRPISEIAPPATGSSVVGMYTHLEHEPLDGRAASQLDRNVCAAIEAAGGRMLVTFATDPAENNYPRHPIRTGEHGLVWLATFATAPTLPLTSVEQRRLAPIARSRMR